ncbi:hypothetical protein JQX13_31135 [Archangium violaceum]|uniref:hypothetical protein n=1 Tax=Archangium violaceum TaxID=83451 RepID=UPI00193C85D9|nr:hypothetical protein [Archangium violaceum]QRK04682.1 hypothetical protein JQX13_31135 [Archangium violaceum]
MADANRSIFRAEALRRHAQGRERGVLPRVIAPRTFVFLWLLAGLSGAMGVLAWATEVPEYVSGLAVVARGGEGGESSRLVVVLPAEAHPRLRVGQELLLESGPPGERMALALTAVEPGLLGPEATHERFGLRPGVAPLVTRPSAIALAAFAPPGREVSAREYVGSSYSVRVRVGSRRLLSRVPFVGPLLGASP